MIKFPAIAAGVLLAAASTFVSAAETKPVGSGPNPFSDCGIGAALFSDTKWAAVSSNVIWDIGTTAVSSATLSPETCSGKKTRTAQFIIDNYDNLAEETARGQGEYLTAMLTVRGCQAEAHTGIVTSIRSEMADHVASSSYSSLNAVEKASQYYEAMDSSVNQLSGSCSS